MNTSKESGDKQHCLCLLLAGSFIGPQPTLRTPLRIFTDQTGPRPPPSPDWQAKPDALCDFDVRLGHANPNCEHDALTNGYWTCEDTVIPDCSIVALKLQGTGCCNASPSCFGCTYLDTYRTHSEVSYVFTQPEYMNLVIYQEITSAPRSDL